jgi:hypothetical protein
MNEHAAAPFDPYLIFVNVGYAIMLLGFVLRDVLKLRSALVVGQIMVVTYNLHRGVYASAVWNSFYMVINVIWVSRILYERRPASIPAEIRDLYEKIFTGFTPKEFLTFWKTGSEKSWDSEVIVNEGSSPADLFLIVAGSADVERGGRKLASLGRGRFFAEMSFMTGQPASADIRGTPQLKTVSWPQTKLRELEKKNPQMFIKLQGIIGGDLAQKVREANATHATQAA